MKYKDIKPLQFAHHVTVTRLPSLLKSRLHSSFASYIRTHSTNCPFSHNSAPCSQIVTMVSNAINAHNASEREFSFRLHI